ncbi:MAG: type II toxin-antitoxin system HicB family antitoxin [Candidatus Scalindua sp.]
MRTYVFKVKLEEENGIWTAVVPSLPGCNAWANNKEDALVAIQENTKAYIETLIEDGQAIPIEEAEIKIPIDKPAVAVTI